MASFLIVEKACFDQYDDIDTSPIGIYGAEVTGFEIYNAMNSQRGDYCNLYSFSQQPVTFEGGGGFKLPSFITGNSVLYCKFESGVSDSSDTNSLNNDLYFAADETLPATLRPTLSVYGDATDKADYIRLDVPPADSFVDVIVVYDDQYNNKLFVVTLANDEPDVATYGREYKLYEIMIGYQVSLPTGYLREDRQTSHKFYGGSQSVSRFGNSMRTGQFSQTPRRSFELSFEDLTRTYRDQLVGCFQYSRGVIPMMYIEDSDDKTTWKKVLMTGVQETADAEAFSLVIGFEEL